jgi:alkanesulfonate monooxygenase SsuD/methylene tetrahydromethanopterin reductase-like flavin-dependent oxidoreductase (luciferase family)
MVEEAFAVYRASFQPSEQLDRPHAMLAINVFAADSDAEGRRLMTTMQQGFANLRLGRPGPLPRPVDDIAARLDAGTLASVGAALACSAVGTPVSVRRALAELIARHVPDEVILTGQIHDHAARLHSFEIAAEVMADLAPLRSGAA